MDFFQLVGIDYTDMFKKRDSSVIKRKNTDVRAENP